MGFVLDYQPFFKLVVRAEGSNNPLSGLTFAPTSHCARRLRDHQMVFRARETGFAVYFAANPQARDPLLGAITDRSRFSFTLHLKDSTFFTRHAPNPATMPAPHMYFDNLEASGAIQTAGQHALSEGAFVDLNDTAHLHPHVFTVQSDLSEGSPPTRYIIQDRFAPAGTVKEVAIGTGGGGALVATRIDLTALASGPYLIESDAAGATPQTIYIDDDLAAQGALGIVDIYWETRQDTVPAGGLDYTLIFKTNS
jgi:hypothetical protein